MIFKSPEVFRWVVISLLVAMVTSNVQVLDDEGDFDYDYEDGDFESGKPLKKPIPEARNPIREQREFVADKEHMKEHMDYPEMLDEDDSDKSLEFHFFKTHDLNSDKMLDGLELWHALEHSMGGLLDDINDASKSNPSHKQRRTERMYMQLEGTIDRILEDDDKNKDGYLTYPEFANARSSHALSRSM